MSEFRDLMGAEQARRDAQLTAREANERAAEEALQEFIGLMIEHQVGQLAVFREVVRPVYREEGFIRTRQVPTGASASTFTRIGEGWLSGINDGSDYVTRELTILDNGDTYWARRITRPNKGACLAIDEDTQKCSGSPFDTPGRRKTLASKALDLIAEKQRPRR